nr:uncharacterized protein LOC115492415 isoform X2 [Taeniopygia guttata]
MRSQQDLGSQQAEVTAGCEVIEVPEPRGCTAPQCPSRQSLSTTVAAAAAVAAVVLTLGQRCQESGGSKSGGTGRGQGTMALALCLLLLLLLVVALPARAAQAAPMKAQGADWDGDLDYYEAVLENGLKFLDDVGAEPVGEGGAASPPIPITELLGDADGVAAGRASPAPLLVTACKPSSHRRGPPTGKIQDAAGKISLEPYKLKQQMLKEMEQARQNGEAVLKAVFPRGSRDSVPASALGREVMPGRVTGDWDRDMAYMENLVKDSLRNLNRGGGPPGEMNQDREDKKSLEAARHLDQMLSDLERRRAMNQESLQKVTVPERSSGLVPAFTAGGQAVPGTGTGEMLGKSSTNAQNGPSTRRIVCPQDVRRSCMIGTVVTLFSVPLVLMGCYLGIRKMYESRGLLKLMLV